MNFNEGQEVAMKRRYKQIQMSSKPFHVSMFSQLLNDLINQNYTCPTGGMKSISECREMFHGTELKDENFSNEKSKGFEWYYFCG